MKKYLAKISILFFATGGLMANALASPSYSLKCWEAYLNNDGLWSMGVEKTESETLAAFSQTPGSEVCANYAASGGVIDQIFASTGVYCKCTAVSNPAPVPEPEIRGPFTSLFSKLQFFYESHSRKQRSLIILGKRALVNQTSYNEGFRLEIQADPKNKAEKSTLEECEIMAFKAVFQPKLTLSVLSEKKVELVKDAKSSWFFQRFFPAYGVIKLGEQNSVRCELK